MGKLIIFLALITGDVLTGDVSIKYSGENVTWTACASPTNPGDFAEFEIYDMETDQLISVGSVPYVNGTASLISGLPKVGMYAGRARSCNDVLPGADEDCSDWIMSYDEPTEEPASCPVGKDYVYAILAPAGPPEL